MLTIFGRSQRFCDGVTRRDFLQIGAVTLGGFGLADLLRAEARAGSTARRRSIINIYLAGGPTHMDTFDLKPTAPAEYRGEFNPIATNVPGIEICELMPNLAKMADKYAIVRSVTGLRNEHAARQSDSGWNTNDLAILGGRPGVGAVVSKLHGTVTGAAPTSVTLSNFGEAGFLGPEYRPYQPDNVGRTNLRLNRSLTEDRLADRQALLTSLDRMRRDVDHSQSMTAMDQFSERAATLVTSGKLADALDVAKEHPGVVEKYGVNQGGRYSGNRNLLLARRLIQAGVRVVGLSWGGWDTHSGNFTTMKQQLPALDVGLSALIRDLEANDMLEDTIILMSGEFGRTPRINSTAGRDHWPSAAFWFLAGGGLRTGQVIGSTNRLGERALDRPVHLQQIYATVYQQLGIDLNQKITDPAGRPQYILDNREPISELI